MFDKSTLDELMKVAMINALGEEGSKRIVNEFIEKITTVKVNKNGNVAYDNYGGGTPDTPLLDYLLKQELRSILETTVREYVQNNSQEFKEKFEFILKSDEGLAKSMATYVSNHLANGTVEINVGFK